MGNQKRWRREQDLCCLNVQIISNFCQNNLNHIIWSGVLLWLLVQQFLSNTNNKMCIDEAVTYKLPGDNRCCPLFFPEYICSNASFKCNFKHFHLNHFILQVIYPAQKYKRNPFVFAPISHELNPKDLKRFLCTQMTYFSQILSTNLSKSVSVSTFPLLRSSIHLTSVACQDVD